MKELQVAVLGMGWMGCVHARAFSQLSRFWDLPLRPRLAMCIDEDPERARWAKDTFGFAAADTDWRAATAAPHIDVVCIAAPTHLHADMAIAAATHGKHIYCEKPAGRDLAETARAEHAARRAGVLSAVGYSYRHFPVVAHCKRLLDDGRMGKVEQFNARFLSMYGGNPLSRLSWRFQNHLSGSGAVADILSHAVDMAHYLSGRIRRVSAMRHTFIPERPLAANDGTHFSLGHADDPKGPVENEDYVAALVEFDHGGRGTLEASRVARGPKCEMGFDMYGSRGSARWNFERMNELQLYLPGDGDDAAAHDGFTRLLGGDGHPQHGRINPGDGIGVGYEDSKVLEVYYFLRDLAAGKQTMSGLTQALAVAQVNDAVLRSCDSGQWEEVHDAAVGSDDAVS